jgi:hypothetical protein
MARVNITRQVKTLPAGETSRSTVMAGDESNGAPEPAGTSSSGMRVRSAGDRPADALPRRPWKLSAGNASNWTHASPTSSSRF